MFSAGVLTPEAMKAFQREVYVMNSLRHPNVVLLMGACQTPPRLAILMEYVPGGSLHKVGGIMPCYTLTTIIDKIKIINIHMYV